VIDPTIKRSLGQMIKGVEVVGAHHDGVTRAYCSHWVTQVSFEEPIVMASVSPKHDTYPLMVASGQFSVSVLAGDQVDIGQYFSYPGRKFRYIADEYLQPIGGDGPGAMLPVVTNCIAWLRCEVFRQEAMEDHQLLFARVVDPGLRLSEDGNLGRMALELREKLELAETRGMLDHRGGPAHHARDDEADIHHAGHDDAHLEEIGERNGQHAAREGPDQHDGNAQNHALPRRNRTVREH